MFKSILKTVGRVLIILAVASLISGGLYLLFGSTNHTALATHGFDGGDFHEEREGGGAFGILQLVQNIGVIGLVITAWLYVQNTINQIKRKSRLTA